MANARRGINVAEFPYIDEVGMPATGNTAREIQRRILVIAAGRENRRKSELDVRTWPKLPDERVGFFAVTVRRGNQKGPKNGTISSVSKGVGPMSDGMTAEAMGNENDGCVDGPDRGVQSRNPLIPRRVAPVSKFSLVRVPQQAKPVALPMRRAGVIQPRYNQKMRLLVAAGFECHDHISIID